MISRISTEHSGVRSLSLIFILVLISFLTIGGCSENNGSGGNGGVGDPPPAPAPQAMCTTTSPPCTNITDNANGTISCDALLGSACAVDLEDVKNQANGTGGSITDDTVMWIEAWGASGGTADPGNFGGDGGYAVTTTTIGDIKSKNNDSSLIYYFYGTPGGDGDSHCGSSGGGSTIVTTEDYVLNPSTNPTQSAPPVLLVAGGGGGRAGENNTGFCDGFATTPTTAAGGGTAIATMSMDGEGAGASTFFPIRASTLLSMGGNQDGMGSGGASGCNVCNSNNNQASGNDGYGGLGGRGGSGNDCGGPQLRTFSNIPSGVFIDFTDGMGGNGSFNQGGDCNAGGGGGGGGYGGGGGGSQQNLQGAGVGGGGGGSFAIQSTQASDLSPTTVQPTPCVNSTANGCVRITFAP